MNYIDLFDEVRPRVLDASGVIVQLGYLLMKMVITDSEIFIRFAKIASLQHRHTAFSNCLSNIKQHFFKNNTLYLYLPPKPI
jgi:hypothetical protein